MSAKLQVMKFGGTSVGDAACMARTAQIIAAAARKNSCIVVVSAMSGVTNRLVEAAQGLNSTGSRASDKPAATSNPFSGLADLMKRKE